MAEFTVKVFQSNPTPDDPHGSWIASVDLGNIGHAYVAETPQQALAGLSVYWATRARAPRAQAEAV
jgi:hypothetical protein